MKFNGITFEGAPTGSVRLDDALERGLRTTSKESYHGNGLDICYGCGMQIKNKKHSIRVIEGGKILTESHEQALQGEIGWFMIGDQCYRRYLKNIQRYGYEI